MSKLALAYLSAKRFYVKLGLPFTIPILFRKSTSQRAKIYLIIMIALGSQLLSFHRKSHRQKTDFSCLIQKAPLHPPTPYRILPLKPHQQAINWR